MNLFLIPANHKNIEATIQKRVSLITAAKFLSADQYAALKSSLGDANSFNCWAMTEKHRSVFGTMVPGDIVLLSVSGTGKFNYAARVVHKIESKNLGDALWGFVPGESWNLIYVMDNLIEIAVNKSELVTAMGYQASYTVPGAVRVNEDHVNRILQQYESISSFLESFGIQVDGSGTQEGTTELERQIQVGGGFGDPETNRKVERAAIACATNWYKSRGWRVESKEASKCGYDLLCAKGEKEEHVEVKGVQGSVVSFPITAGEVREAKTNRKFFLFVVTLALSGTPEIHQYSGDAFMKGFVLKPIAYRASLRIDDIDKA